MNLNSFETAFRDRAGSCRINCACGILYYFEDSWNVFFDGDLEELKDSGNAVPLDHSPEFITFEGVEYAVDCACWHPRAVKIMMFLDSHGAKIAEYYNQEKMRLAKELDEVPTIEVCDHFGDFSK